MVTYRSSLDAPIIFLLPPLDSAVLFCRRRALASGKWLTAGTVSLAEAGILDPGFQWQHSQMMNEVMARPPTGSAPPRLAPAGTVAHLVGTASACCGWGCGRQCRVKTRLLALSAT